MSFNASVQLSGSKSGLFQAPTDSVKAINWRDRAISKLNSFDRKLEEKIPNFTFQTKVDSLGQEIEEKFKPLTAWNNWLNHNGHGSWYSQLAWCLCKLPLRAARNIVQQLYVIIRSVVYGAIHPLKALNAIAKLLVALPHEFIKPETWSKMGAGMMGAGAGEAALASGFVSLIGIAVGGALIVGGVSAGALKAALEAEKGARGQAASSYLLKMGQELPETFLTSFYMSVVIGAIRKAVKNRQLKIKQKELQQKHDLQAAEQAKAPKAPDFYRVVELCRNNPDRFPPVAYAVKLGRHDVVKFLLDNKESANAVTPHFEIWEDIGDWNIRYAHVATEPGYSPLELAIKNKDTEMVKILTSYNPNNVADPAFSIARYPYIRPIDGGRYGFDYFKDNVDYRAVVRLPVTSSPLSQAIALGNKEMIESLIKAYATPEKLSGAFATIQATKQTDLMRLWLEQNAFLWKGTVPPISDETVRLFTLFSLEEALKTKDELFIKQLLDNGWLVSSQEAKIILQQADPAIVDLLVKGARLQVGVEPLKIAIELGAVDTLKTYILQGTSFEGMLMQATVAKQTAVVEYLLTLPVSQNEIQAAFTKAYELHAYDILDMINDQVIRQ